MCIWDIPVFLALAAVIVAFPAHCGKLKKEREALEEKLNSKK